MSLFLRCLLVTVFTLPGDLPVLSGTQSPSSFYLVLWVPD